MCDSSEGLGNASGINVNGNMAVNINGGRAVSVTGSMTVNVAQDTRTKDDNTVVSCSGNSSDELAEGVLLSWLMS